MYANLHSTEHSQVIKNLFTKYIISHITHHYSEVLNCFLCNFPKQLICFRLPPWPSSIGCWKSCKKTHSPTADFLRPYGFTWAVFDGLLIWSCAQRFRALLLVPSFCDQKQCETEEHTQEQSECPLWKEMHKPRVTASRFFEVAGPRGDVWPGTGKMDNQGCKANQGNENSPW